MRFDARRTLPWLLTSTALVAWSAQFLYQASFVAFGQRVFVLADDAMISMTYAKNLVHGFGFNWARFGAPVEGYSHPLWTFLMIPVHLLGLPTRLTSLVMALLSLGCLVANLWAVDRLVRTHLAAGKGAPPWPALGPPPGGP